MNEIKNKDVIKFLDFLAPRGDSGILHSALVSNLRRQLKKETAEESKNYPRASTHTKNN